MSWRRLWLNLHLALALAGGLLLSVISVTGSLNVYFFEIDEWLNPELVADPNQGPKRPLSEIAATLEARFPGAKGGWRFELPRHERGALHVWYSPPEDKASDAPGAPKSNGDLSAPMVSIDPYTARIVAYRDFYNDTLVGFIYKLHMTLLLPVKPGQTLAGVLAGGMVLSIASGIYLWWPRHGSWRWAFSLKRAAGPDRRLFDIHRLTGISSAAVLFAVAISGFYFVFNEAIKPVIEATLTVTPDDSENASSTPIAGREPISADEAVRIGMQAFPSAELKGLMWPGDPEDLFVVNLRQPGEANITFPATKVVIDQWSGEVLATRDPARFRAGDTLLNLMYPLHSGEALGELGRALVFAAGFAVPVLFVTGLMRWLRKRRARTETRASVNDRA